MIPKSPHAEIVTEITQNQQMALIRTNATMPPKHLCVVRDSWISKPNSFSTVIDSKLESNVVGCRFMDRQFEFLGDISDEITSPLPSCSLDASSLNETPVASRIVRHDDGLQSSDVESNSVARISLISSCSELKRKPVDFVKSRLNFQCNQVLETVFDTAFSVNSCKKVKRDVV